jgi:phosphohistidine phosphatase
LKNHDGNSLTRAIPDMSALMLLRHAKAAAASSGMRDVERPLDSTGLDEANRIGAAMHREGYRPAAILCSTSLRTRQTLDCLGSHIDTRDAKYSELLYSSDSNGYLAIIRQAGDPESLLIIGHNPMTAEIATLLVSADDEGAHRRLRSGFPTAGLAVLNFPGALSDVSTATGRLIAFETPGSVRND